MRKYTAEEIQKGLNIWLKDTNISIRKIEKQVNCFILHKITPLVKDFYLKELHKDKLPKKIGITEAQILLGRLAGAELDYRKKVRERKKGQKNLREFW